MARFQSQLVGFVDAEHYESHATDDDEINDPDGRFPEVDQAFDFELYGGWNRFVDVQQDEAS
mgnify:CR=1 FL=1|jgi:hypothetical protein